MASAALDVLKGAPFALIYADKAQPGGIDLGEKELSLLRTLRNQAVMAFNNPQVAEVGSVDFFEK